MATFEHSDSLPSPGLSLMMSSSLGDAMFTQGNDYAVAAIERMLYGECLLGEEELDPWVLFVQTSYQRHTTRHSMSRRRRRR